MWSAEWSLSRVLSVKPTAKTFGQTAKRDGRDISLWRGAPRIGRVNRKRAFGYAQNVRIHITPRIRKISSGFFALHHENMPI